MSAFELYLLCSYNENIGNRLHTNCHHYLRYKTEQAFKTNVVDQRGSYMGCFIYESNSRKRINHLSVPIMFGSFIDRLIRGDALYWDTRVIFGAFYLTGNMKIYSNLSTFNALTVHVRQNKIGKYVEWYFYVDDDGVALKYLNGIVEYEYKRNKYADDGWVNLINSINNIIDSPIPKDEYLDLFDSMLATDYDINDLKNRQILTAPLIMKRFIENDLKKRRLRNSTGCMSMAKSFEYGKIFSCIEKNGTFDQDGYRIQKDQSYVNTLHDGRSNKTCYFLPAVTRVSNEGTKNATTVYPDNAYMYLCPLNTKELKTAGDQHMMSDFVIITEETSEFKLIQYLKRNNKPNGTNRIVVNSMLTNFYMNWSLDELLKLKTVLPHITTQYTIQYVHIHTKAGIMVKFSSDYNKCFSTAERDKYDIKWPEAGPLSTAAKLLNHDGLRRSMPAKNTVAINNIKGSVAIAHSKMHKLLMSSSLGLTCYLDMDENKKQSIYNKCVKSYNNDTTIYRKNVDFLKKFTKFNIDELYNKNTVMEDVSMVAFKRYLTKLYNFDRLAMVYMKPANKRGQRVVPYQYGLLWIDGVSSRQMVEVYVSDLLKSKHMKLKDIRACEMNVCFGNIYGSCVLDGVVIDKSTAEIIPNIQYYTTITVAFTFNNNKDPHNVRFIKIDDGGLENMRQETLIGALITNYVPQSKNSKHCTVNVVKVGEHYYNLIHFLPKKHKIYKNMSISHIIQKNQIIIIIKGHHESTIKKGVKFAIEYGQKNICSDIVDFSGEEPTYIDESGIERKQVREYWGITRDGRKTHAQLMFSDQSIFSRLTSGQLYNMLTSKDLALGPNGEILAPLPVLIHSINTYTNLKIFDVKADTLTNSNGYDTQLLSTTNHSFRPKEKNLNRVLQLIGMHTYDVRIDHRLMNKSLLSKRNLKSRLYAKFWELK